MNLSLKIKVCGMRQPENLEKVCALKPDFVGFIFYPESKRFVGNEPDPVLFEIPSAGTLKVGVFVNEQISQVKRIFELYRLDLVQLHGAESPDYSNSLKDAGIHVIKALDPKSVKHRSEIGQDGFVMRDYVGAVQYLLFDTPGIGFGGTGRKFDWKSLEEFSIPVPYLIGGGIGPGDAATIRETGYIGLSGIDINSRFERSPGFKDVRLLEKFIMEIRK